MRSVAVIGQGFVGGSLTTVFAEKNYAVYVYDITGKVAKGGRLPYNEKLQQTNIEQFIKACNELENFSNVFFICLPTPMLEDGAADLSIVENTLEKLASIQGERIAVIKSTVPPGTVEKFNAKYSKKGLHIIFNPEFLTEANALNDMRNQTRIILGGPRPWINIVKQIYKSAFPTVPIIKTSSTNAELVKYVTNCFLATKISFANEIYQVCEALDKQGLNVDYDRVIECATLDKRLGCSHWQVPSFETDENGKPLFGFSLSCFPKDLNALIKKEIELGVKPTVLKAVWEKNLEVRPQKDWNKLVGRAVSIKKNT